MAQLNLNEVERRVKPLANQESYNKDFIFDMLVAYGRSPGGIARLKSGQLNVAADKEQEVAQKNIVYFKPTKENLYAVIDDLKLSPTVIRFSTRFVIVTNYEQLLAIDTKTEETLDINISDIDKHFTFFLPWAGMEKAQYVAENHADVKAAEKMAKLFDAIIECNHFTSPDEWHGLNVFFSRLLFCYFAEDTEIFTKGQFTNAIASFTQLDGSDLQDFLKELFTALDIKDKTGYPAHIAAFPYVNGKLFHETHIVPEFNKKARDLLIECGGKLDWSNINPDIFGSMIQAVVNPGQRAGLGMHYTSVPNIMKTIDPLFLDELKEEFNKSIDDSVKLEKLLLRISKIKIFDPACGSGNFLIIAYKELRRLEHAILERQGELGATNAALLGSRINIENFYGIEIDDFAHEVAILSIWLVKHQMNVEFSEKFGIDLPLIPLHEAGSIVQGNAAFLDWRNVCPNDEDEVYIISNPPYLGGKLQNIQQKRDVENVLGHFNKYKDLDYIAVWFYKATEYMRPGTKFAFVTTNSIFQGTQVPNLWPPIFEKGLEIFFAYKNFKWSNSAKKNAGVICSVVGLRLKMNGEKFIVENGLKEFVNNINAYLIDGPDIIVTKRNSPISEFPYMYAGNTLYDDGNLILSINEKQKILREYPEAGTIIKKLTGSKEFINGVDRYCLWIDNSDLDLALSIPSIKQRISNVKAFRTGDEVGVTAKSCSDRPHQFCLRRKAKKSLIVIPAVSSERRQYIPMGFLDADTIITNLAYAIYDAETYLFGVLSSRMHMIWTRLFAGRLKNDFRYSTGVNYNTFPFPKISEIQKEQITQCVFDVLDARESHSEMTLASLYDPDKMPDNLHVAHTKLDNVIDMIYRKKPFENDDERLAHLFDLYESMTEHEKEKK